LIHAPEQARRTFPQIVQIATGGAAPPSTVIARMEAMGFAVTHLYGLTESYGPSTVCMWQPELDDINSAFRGSDFRFRELMVAAVASDVYRNLPGGER